MLTYSVRMKSEPLRSEDEARYVFARSADDDDVRLQSMCCIVGSANISEPHRRGAFDPTDINAHLKIVTFLLDRLFTMLGKGCWKKFKLFQPTVDMDGVLWLDLAASTPERPVSDEVLLAYRMVFALLPHVQVVASRASTVTSAAEAFAAKQSFVTLLDHNDAYDDHVNYKTGDGCGDDDDVASVWSEYKGQASFASDVLSRMANEHHAPASPSYASVPQTVTTPSPSYASVARSVTTPPPPPPPPPSSAWSSSVHSKESCAYASSRRIETNDDDDAKPAAVGTSLMMDDDRCAASDAASSLMRDTTTTASKLENQKPDDWFALDRTSPDRMSVSNETIKEDTSCPRDCWF